MFLIRIQSKSILSLIPHQNIDAERLRNAVRRNKQPEFYFSLQLSYFWFGK